MSKRIIVSVISNLATDQRVHKVCTTLHEYGYNVLLIGSKHSNTANLPARDYKVVRLHLWCTRGFMKYAEWNIKLCLYLLYHKADILLANDLDTLLPNYIVQCIKKNNLVYDTHEYFTEQEEVYNRKWVKRIWLGIEKRIFPHLKNVYTVNETIAKVYTKLYAVPVHVVRNVPILVTQVKADKQLQEQYHIPIHNKILLTQGIGLHYNRGIEELIQCMQHLPNEYTLVIVGSGLAVPQLKQLVLQLNLQDKVIFVGILPPQVLKQITPLAYCGFSLDKPTCLNYAYSLPNKLFDYIHAGIPVIASNVVEVANIIHTYKVGIVLQELTPHTIASAVLALKRNDDDYNQLKQHCKLAADVLNWQCEAVTLLQLFQQVK